MGYSSSLLGSNVVSSYLHIDNLRNDLTTGKYYETAGTKYLQILHDGTDGKISTSSGMLKFIPASSNCYFYNSAANKVFNISISTHCTLANDTGNMIFEPGAGNIVQCYKNAQVIDFRVESGTAGKYLNFEHTTTAGVIQCVTGNLNLQATSGIVAASTSGTLNYLYAYNADGATYTRMGNNAIDTNGNVLYLTSALGYVYMLTAGVASVLYIFDSGGVANINLSTDLISSSGMLWLKSGVGNAVKIGVSTSASGIQLYDNTLAAWKTLKIDNGAVVIS